MSNINSDFLRFNAYSIKDLITRKLSEDTRFTDQVYEGSNLAVLIDIVSYMYQCLLFQLNNAAAESMFSDTRIYENMSRLCKFIGYHPKAFRPAQMNAYLDNIPEIENKKIYPCSAIDTKMTDSQGNKIYFSTEFDDKLQVTEGQYTNIPLINGIWKVYGTTFTATGEDYETFVLGGLASDSDENRYVSNNRVRVVTESNGVFDTEWSYDQNEIFLQAYNNNGDQVFSKLYNQNSKVFTSYINEDKIFEIKFGDGIVGKKLNRGDKVYVIYLETNGPDGYIDLSKLDFSNIKICHSPDLFGITKDVYNGIFGNPGDDNIDTVDSIEDALHIDSNTLTVPRAEEDVDDIRNNAPNWFKQGNRLITKKDYEVFLTSSQHPMFENIVDVKCMNNWDYMTQFYRWLYNLGMNPNQYSEKEKNGYRYIEKARILQSGFEYVDSADANNIYLWIKTSDQTNMKSIKNNINDTIQDIKTMTSETYTLAPIDVMFDITFTPEELYYELMTTTGQDVSFDTDLSYLEVTVTDDSIYSNITIKNKIASIITQYFDVNKCTLGQTVDANDILDQIYDINGVTRIRTVFYPTDENVRMQYGSRSCDGISFATWSDTDLIDIGDDLKISNQSRTLEQFQFPAIASGIDITDKIKVIKKSMNTTNPVKF